MGLGKKDIIKNISTKTHFNSKYSKEFLEKFLFFIKSKKNIKISNFGVFRMHLTKPRIGRNPSTKVSFNIPEINKLTFRASSKVKSIIN